MKKLLSAILALTLILALAPMALASKDEDDVAYPVEGGNIYIDEATKTVTDADYNVTAAVIPDSVTSIGDSAFSICRSLVSVTIPDSVTLIGDSAFFNCSSLANITIPDSVTSIGGRAFEGCTSLTSATISASMTEIGYNAFYGCTALTDVTIPDSVTSIVSAAFSGCTSLANITIPDSVTSIGLFAFSGCTSLAGIAIPDSVTSIGERAFENCTALTGITIPGSVTSIGNAAFYGCSSLSAVTIPDSVTSLGVSTFVGCASLTAVTIPDSVTSIGDSVFARCGLTSITIPDSVTSIERDAFNYCASLTSVTIPGSVTSIAAVVFDGCTSLTDIYYGGSEEQWNSAIKTDGEAYYEYGYYVCDPSQVTIHYNSTVPGDTTAPASFTDAQPGGVYTNAVNWATENKFADPVSSATFGTADPCPRWEVVSIIWKAMDSPEPETTVNPFTDVSEADPYYKAILWAYENGITTGVSETEFGVDVTVKRGDAMTFIWRAASKPASDAANPFADVAAGKYYEAPVLWAVENGITNGTDATHFAPENSVTRGQMVTFLYRWLVENK